MKQWEYYFLSTHLVNSGRDHEFDNLGKEGWELVHIESWGSPGEVTCVFKREKDGDRDSAAHVAVHSVRSTDDTGDKHGGMGAGTEGFGSTRRVLEFPGQHRIRIPIAA